MIFKISSIFFIIIGTILFFISKKQCYNKLYLLRCLTYISFYTSLFIYLIPKINICSTFKSLDVITTISATIAGFVFAGISIVFALIGITHIKSLFENDFLDKVFYKAYSTIALCIGNIIIYAIIIQFNFQNYCLIILNQYLFFLSILLFSLMIFDFTVIIRRAKK